MKRGSTILRNVSKLPLCRIWHLTAMVTDNSIFWNITSYSPLKVNWRFGGTCHFHLHGQRISQERNQYESRWQAKDGGDIFFIKVSWFQTDYTALYPEDRILQTSTRLHDIAFHEDNILHSDRLENLTINFLFADCKKYNWRLCSGRWTGHKRHRWQTHWKCCFSLLIRVPPPQ
jgi:hypothetical protein